jgi:outer membrane biosynthesis protein TonB
VQQKELLKLLNEERRARHRELANKDKKKRSFQPGDLVLVRKQVTSKANDGKPAKLTLRARGPYRILEPAGDNSYWLQKIPAIQGLNRRKGRKHRELAMRLEKLPSSLVIHKRVDTLDTRMAEMEGQLAHNPLERNLGFFDFGKYTQAPEDEDFAFVKLNEMWNEPIDARLDSEDDESEDEPDETTPETPNPPPATTIATVTETETAPIPAERTNPNRETTQTHNKRQHTTTKEATRKRRKSMNKRKRPDEEAPTPDKRIKAANITTTDQYLRQLWQDTSNSTDRLFFLRRQDPGNTRAQWHLVQADLDETSHRQAKAYGTYHVRYYIRHHLQSKTRTTQECKHWPLIREIRPDGNFGAIIMIQPDRVDRYLAKRPSTVGWYQLEANLAEDGLVGPFNFSQIKGEHNRIDPQHWTALLDKSNLLNVDARDVTKIIPLG